MSDVASLGLGGLPGAEGIVRGLEDLNAGAWTVEACLIAAAATRLRGLGLPLPGGAALPKEPELMLYELLSKEYDAPYPRYNSLRQELDSFIAALQARLSRRTPDGVAQGS